MKKKLVLFLCLTATILFAQKPCEYVINTTDSIGTYKSMKDYLMYEKNFAGNSSYIFFTLENNNKTPFVNLTIIRKSKEFIPANCLDGNSKIFLQLNNGKIATLVFAGNENCGSLIRDEKGFDNRLLSGTFMFLKGSMEDLKTAPLNLMRIQFLSEMEDFVIKKEIQSELNGQTYKPETLFIDYLNCIE
ncbi:MAG: hypothetical protein K9I26_03455 [Flavobacterium sp.]|nr:hypothetical protein [Flavobacterium sp.]